jgi:16S rRNA (guanine527-N7)-methyltransferase
VLGRPLSEEEEQALAGFAALLRDKAVPAGLIAESDLPRLVDRHILDSLRAIPAFSKEEGLAYDLGSGAGLPGIPLAVVRPRWRFVLCDSSRRRVAFLELAVQHLGLANAEVTATRAEELPAGADVVTSRAFAPLSRLWPVARALLRPGGRVVYFAGAGLADPSAEAARVAGGEAEVAEIGLLASSPPLVMMTRR